MLKENGIDKMPNLKDKLAKELLKDKQTHIKVNDEVINSKDRSCTVVEIL